MPPTLLLNFTYEPLRVIDWKKAVILIFLGKAEAISSYDKVIRSVSFSMPLPAVVRLLKYVKNGRKTYMRFSRENVFIRDNYTCQYCGKKFPPSQLTYDHVIPKSRGGATDWTNIVTCCKRCNRIKGGRTPEEAGMKLIKQPRRPIMLPGMQVHRRNIPEEWKPYLFLGEKGN